MTVEIQLQGATQPFTVRTDGDPEFVAAQIRKMASSGDGFAVLTLLDGSLLLVHPASTWIRLLPTPTTGPAMDQGPPGDPPAHEHDVPT